MQALRVDFISEFIFLLNMQLKVEIGAAFVSLALALFFISYFISLFQVFTKPLDIGTAVVAQQSWQKIFIGTSVFGIPTIGVSVATYILAKRNALKIVSIILIIQGIIIIIGMLLTLNISNNFINEYKELNMDIIPKIFLIAGVIPIALGIHISRLKPQKRSRFFTEQ